MPDYSTWTKDQLIERVLVLEDVLYPTEAGDLVQRIPIVLGPNLQHILRLIVAASPRFVPYHIFLEEIWGGEESALGILRVNIVKLRKKLRPSGIEILSRPASGQGYALDTENFLKLKDLALVRSV